MRKLLLFHILFLFYSYHYAQGNLLTNGARQEGMANATVTLTDVYSLHYNQAGLGFLKQPQIAFAFKNRFLIAGLNQMAFYYAHPTKLGTFGTSINYFGFNLYNETKLGVSYGKRFGKKIAIGLQFNYLRLFIAEHGSKHLFVAETGITYKPLTKIAFAFHIYNLAPYKIATEQNQRLPTTLKMGLGYTPNKKVTLIAQTEITVTQTPNIKVGMEYKFIEAAQLRAGINTNPVSFNLGFGSYFKNMGIDIAGAYNLQLGLTPSISLKYALAKSKKNE